MRNSGDARSAVILLKRLEELVRGLVRRGAFEEGEEIAERVGQRRLVVLDRQHEVGLPVPDGLGDVGLCSQGVDGDDAAFERQRVEQQRNRRLLVRLLGRCGLAQHDAGTGGKGADQVQGRRIDLA